MAFFDWLFRKPEPPVSTPLVSAQVWSYCESDFGTADGFWCIRRLTRKGRTQPRDRMDRIDSESLCGRVEVGHGWDLYSVVQRDHNLEKRACPKCKAIWLARNA